MSRSRSSRALTALIAVAALATTASMAATPPANAADPVTITGTFTTPAGTPREGYPGYLYFHSESGNTAFIQFGADGAYSADLYPDTYSVDVNVQVTQPNHPEESDGGISYTTIDTTIGPYDVAEAGTLNLDVPAYPVQLTVTDPQGDPATYASVSVRCNETRVHRWTDDGGDEQVESTDVDVTSSRGLTTPTNPTPLWAIPVPDDENGQPRCWVGYGYPSGANYSALDYRRAAISAGPNAVAVAMGPPVTLSGQVDLPAELAIYRHGSVMVETKDGDPVAQTGTTLQGGYHVQVPPGDDYNIRFRLSTGELWKTANVHADTVVDFPMHAVPVTTHIANAEPDVEYYVSQNCTTPARNANYKHTEGISDTFGTSYGPETTQFSVLIPNSNDGWRCDLSLVASSDEEEAPARRVPAGIGPGHQEMTFYADSRILAAGAPGVSVDEDGVDDTVESQGPNGGDGNHDGIADYQQNHVTSVPAFGSTETHDAPYVTLAGPTGSSLVNVTTTDPADAATPPPDGSTLPAGLVSFTLEDIEPGSTQSVELWTNGSLYGVTGYAKYDAVAHTWSMLPADRVEVSDDHVTIRLTDGGIGDADHTENGVIVDPGGPAAPPEGDSTPPEVTGSATTRPNSAGWYRNNVRVRWTATDAESGVEAAPRDTVVTTEGDNVTATSPEVCDTAPARNCTNGEVTGLQIDKTAPSVSITGVSNGATYTLGSVPTPRCTASDALSGIAGTCKGVRAGGRGNGAGTFTYSATAADKAGNARVVTATYRVLYRFDGFAQPLNDPGPPMSVFRAGSTVPVAFSLRFASGTGSPTPTSKPVWVSPVRGARTSSPINEAVSNAKGTSGSSFVWKNNRWQFDWSTKGLSAGYIYRIGVRLDDGTTHVLNIGLR